MSARRGERFPLEPLEAVLGRPTARQLAERVGVVPCVVQAARRRGLSVRHADEWAIRAGLHPAIVWPAW